MMRESRRRPMAHLLLSAVAALTMAVPQSARADGYRIASGDRVAVFLNGELALGIEQQVGPDGAVAVAYVGRVTVDGLTASGAQDRIREALERADVYSTADVLVVVTEFRPVFVSGAVGQPGSLPFSPGLTVGRAVAAAGGLPSLAAMADASPGTVIQLTNASAELTRERRAYLRAGLAAQRLTAQAEGASDPSFAAPPGLQMPPDVAAAAVAVERARFDLLEAETRRTRQLHVDNIQLLEVEVATVEARKRELEALVRALGEDLAASEEAVGRGALIQSTERELRFQTVLGTIERNLSLARIDLLETDRNLTVARQRLVEERAEQQSFENERTLSLNDELASQSDAEAVARDRVAALEAQLFMAPTLMSAPEEQAAGAPVYTVERNVDGSMRRMSVEESFPLLPGDLLVVSTQAAAGEAGEMR
jgi:protein involved in polysaccharide export with SLBB domain